MILDRDNWTEILSTMKTNLLRSFLTAFGVFWGIFMLIIMVGTGRGLENGVLSEFSGYATNSLFLWSRNTTKPFEGYPKGRRIRFKNDDIAAIHQNVPEVEFLAPRNRLNSSSEKNNIVYQLKTGTYSIYGDYPEIQHIQLMRTTAGRFINRLDLENKRKVVVIGSQVFDDASHDSRSMAGVHGAPTCTRPQIVQNGRLPATSLG